MVNLHHPIKQWEIYFADLSPTRGSEQAGKRPVLILSRDEVNYALTTCTVIPFTSYKNNKKIHPTQLFLDKRITRLPVNSVLLFNQIRTISKTRLNEKIAGIITDPFIKTKINEKIAEYFDLL